MKWGVVLLALVASGSGAWAFDPTPLPPSCKETLAGMQGDKARFAGLNKVMARSRKASDTGSFCNAARQTVLIIKGQSDRLDGCVGDLAGAAVPQGTADEMIQLRGVYKQMLEAAKDPKNDRFKCGLADQ